MTDFCTIASRRLWPALHATAAELERSDLQRIDLRSGLVG